MAPNLITWAITAMILAGTTGIVWQAFRPWYERDKRRQKRSGLEKPPPPPPPEFRRPAEFGPLYVPRDQVEHMRAAIITDQLAARQESPKQRRHRGMKSHPPGYEQERVQHWLLHWQDNVHIRWALTSGQARITGVEFRGVTA